MREILNALPNPRATRSSRQALMYALPAYLEPHGGFYAYLIGNVPEEAPNFGISSRWGPPPKINDPGGP
jgi:hypothetical protein